MRFFEWILLFSFVPLILVPFIPPAGRRRAWFAAAPLPLLATVLHLAVEGWRIQMVPAYPLAVLAAASLLLPALTRPGGVLQRRLGKVLSIGMALALALCGVLAGWLMPVLSLPAPTGPYRVGIVDRELVDAARGRRLMVSVWYPTEQRGAPAPLTQYPDAVAEGLGNLSGLPALAFQQLRYTRLAASGGVPAAAEGAPFPALVFSHGMVGLRLQNSSNLQELASWGYIVVAVDHTDAAAVTVFPDGETRFYSLEPFGISAADGEPDHAMMNEKVFPVWVADQRFVYDTLEQWAFNDPLLAGKLDLKRIGSFGHSFGGATALEVCRVDPRCKAAVDLDGGLYGAVETQPAVRPILLMSSAESRKFAETVAAWTHMITNASAPASWLELPGSTHFSFTITQLLTPVLTPKGYDPRAGLGIVDQTLRLFFDHTLRGRELSSSDCREMKVRWITQNLCP